MAIQKRDLASQPVRQHDIVRIEIRDEFATGLAQPNIPCDRRGDVRMANDADPGITRRRPNCFRFRLIGAARVDEHDQFKVLKTACEYAFHCLRDESRAVEDRHDNGDSRRHRG